MKAPCVKKYHIRGLIPAPRRNTRLSRKYRMRFGAGGKAISSSRRLSLTAWSCHHAMSRYRSLFGCAFHSRRALHRRTCGGAQKQCQRTVSADRLSRGHTASGNDLVDQSEAAEPRSSAGAACAFGLRGAFGVDDKPDRRRSAGCGGNAWDQQQRVARAARRGPQGCSDRNHQPHRQCARPHHERLAAGRSNARDGSAGEAYAQSSVARIARDIEIEFRVSVGHQERKRQEDHGQQ